MAREYSVIGGGGVTLHVRESGNPDGPAIVFVHGWSQCDRCWGPPTRASTRRELSARHVRQPRARNVRQAGAVQLTPSYDHIGSGLLENAQEMCLPDLGANIAATRRFLRACTASPLQADLWESALCWNMIVPPQIRGALLAREIDGDDVLAKLTVPTLVIHGLDDEIVLPSMARHVVERCPTADASWYEGIGHMPFVEAADRFDRELATFAELSAGRLAPR